MGDSNAGPSSEPSPGDHYRANGAGPVESGYYRVVGRDAEAVSLLHVGDDEGRRRHTGRVESVERSRLDALEPAEAPGSGPLDSATGAVEALWLSAWMVPGNLRDRPGQLLLGAALLVAAALGPALLPGGPASVFEAANLLGALLVGAAAVGLPR